MIKSIQYEATVSESGGWKSTVSYAKEGDKYRVTRKDHPPAASRELPSSKGTGYNDISLGSKREPLDKTMAYNGQRYQDLDHVASILKLTNAADGVVTVHAPG